HTRFSRDWSSDVCSSDLCPIVDVLEPGVFTPNIADADIRTDISRYRIFEHGEPVTETNDITSYWRDDFVTFLIGCSFTFERALRSEERRVGKECRAGGAV